ncbi:hypothetical protein BRADI_5g17075v3 [Brachypodium distachyon]|uniref:Uncharacterized protein n=1 Tax=Brachypodium distachyon TaxID=15368 RepID=A0A0Q3ICJ5_BRADI|nr:hypothetical protein BRADI_5g17075v3 [Brachypodium distachyon]
MTGYCTRSTDHIRGNQTFPLLLEEGKDTRNPVGQSARPAKVIAAGRRGVSFVNRWMRAPPVKRTACPWTGRKAAD